MSIDIELREARSALVRVPPEQADALRGDGAFVVDIRPRQNRLREGEIPGSIVIERIVLEWRLEPDGAHSIDGLSRDSTVVLVCNEGYASSLAARDLVRLGLRNATDLIGGFRAWADAGLATQAGGSQPIT